MTIYVINFLSKNELSIEDICELIFAFELIANAFYLYLRPTLKYIYIHHIHY